MRISDCSSDVCSSDLTYWSRTSRISFGLGSELRADWAFSSSSSRMMSLHSFTHSSQMNTLGPAISLRTSCWLFPQKEQYRILLLSPERLCRSLRSEEQTSAHQSLMRISYAVFYLSKKQRSHKSITK